MEKINLLLFIEIIIISIIVCPFCGSNPPLDSSYCGNYLSLNSTHRCCYCLKKNMKKYYCLLIINGNYSKEDYECNCEFILENDDLPGAPCRNHSYVMEHTDNLTKEYCHKLSIDEKHPCCYYDNGNFKTCFGIGKISSDTLYTYNNFLDCFSNYLKFSYFIIFFYLIFFF